MRAIEILTGAVLALALAVPAAAAPLDDAKQILDATAPMHCELLKMQFQARGTPQDSPAYAELAQRYAARSAAIERALAADMQRFEQARAMLDARGRDELSAHGTALLQACASEANRETGMQIPVQPEAKRKLKVAPYVPAEKSLSPGAMPNSPVEAQNPQ